MFGTPDHLDDCGKIDHRCPFWWIKDPAPFLFDSVGQHEAIRYAARADKNFHNFNGVTFFHPAPPFSDGPSSFYVFWLGGSMPEAWSEGRLEGSLSRSLNQTHQTNQTDQMNLILLQATKWRLAPSAIARMVLRAKIPYHLAPQGEEEFREEPVQSPEDASVQRKDDDGFVLGYAP